ncbi:hypothetical protein SUGI_0881580 [Cryptomeria japonica]|nr:hypothetical protein SUGI_0881580 [Cryptomeria japonica]
MLLRVAPWARVSSSLPREAQSWASVAKGGRFHSRFRVESTGGFVVTLNQDRFAARDEGFRQGFGFHSRSWPIPENARWVGGSDRLALVQRDYRQTSGGVSRSMGNPTLTAMTLVPMAKSASFILSEEVEKEVKHNEVVFSELGLIGRFLGRWPSLGEMHKWISVNWEPLVEDYVQIYPHAHGFFVVVFQSVADKNKVLGSGQWS